MLRDEVGQEGGRRRLLAREYGVDELPAQFGVRVPQLEGRQLGHATSASIRAECTSGGSCSTCRSYQSVNESSPHSWRLRSSMPATCSPISRETVSGRKSPWRVSVSPPSVSPPNGPSPPPPPPPPGIHKPPPPP